MKKFFLAISTFIYMVLSCGVAMEIHYCMGTKAGVELYGNVKEKCSKCGMTEKKGCCHDEHKFYKIDDSHKNVTNNINSVLAQPVVVINYPLFNRPVSLNNVVAVTNTHSPPDYTGPSACILNCVFRL
jgi:hypothetical protein